MSKSCASWSKPRAFKVAVCIQERHCFRRLYQVGGAAIAFRSKEEKIGVRSHCGPFVKTSSLKGDSTLQQAKLQLAGLVSAGRGPGLLRSRWFTARHRGEVGRSRSRD